jgi:hypothetical protein
MEHWWDDTDKEKPKSWEKILSPRHFVQRTSHMDMPGTESGPPR